MRTVILAPAGTSAVQTSEDVPCFRHAAAVAKDAGKRCEASWRTFSVFYGLAEDDQAGPARVVVLSSFCLLLRTSVMSSLFTSALEVACCTCHCWRRFSSCSFVGFWTPTVASMALKGASASVMMWGRCWGRACRKAEDVAFESRLGELSR